MNYSNPRGFVLKQAARRAALTDKYWMTGFDSGKTNIQLVISLKTTKLVTSLGWSFLTYNDLRGLNTA